MKAFLKFAKLESHKLRKKHNEIVAAAITSHPHREVLRIEQESSKSRLYLADELERAAKIVRQTISIAKDLQENGGLS